MLLDRVDDAAETLEVHDRVADGLGDAARCRLRRLAQPVQRSIRNVDRLRVLERGIGRGFLLGLIVRRGVGDLLQFFRLDAQLLGRPGSDLGQPALGVGQGQGAVLRLQQEQLLLCRGPVADEPDLPLRLCQLIRQFKRLLLPSNVGFADAAAGCLRQQARVLDRLLGADRGSAGLVTFQLLQLGAVLDDAVVQRLEAGGFLLVGQRDRARAGNASGGLLVAEVVDLGLRSDAVARVFRLRDERFFGTDGLLERGQFGGQRGLGDGAALVVEVAQRDRARVVDALQVLLLEIGCGALGLQLVLVFLQRLVALGLEDLVGFLVLAATSRRLLVALLDDVARGLLLCRVDRRSGCSTRDEPALELGEFLVLLRHRLAGREDAIQFGAECDGRLIGGRAVCFGKCVVVLPQLLLGEFGQVRLLSRDRVAFSAQRRTRRERRVPRLRCLAATQRVQCGTGLADPILDRLGPADVECRIPERCPPVLGCTQGAIQDAEIAVERLQPVGQRVIDDGLRLGFAPLLLQRLDLLELRQRDEVQLPVVVGGPLRHVARHRRETLCDFLGRLAGGLPVQRRCLGGLTEHLRPDLAGRNQSLAEFTRRTGSDGAAVCNRAGQRSEAARGLPGKVAAECNGVVEDFGLLGALEGGNAERDQRSSTTQHRDPERCEDPGDRADTSPDASLPCKGVVHLTALLQQDRQRRNAAAGRCHDVADRVLQGQQLVARGERRLAELPGLRVERGDLGNGRFGFLAETALRGLQGEDLGARLAGEAGLLLEAGQERRIRVSRRLRRCRITRGLLPNRLLVDQFRAGLPELGRRQVSRVAQFTQRSQLLAVGRGQTLLRIGDLACRLSPVCGRCLGDIGDGALCGLLRFGFPQLTDRIGASGADVCKPRLEQIVADQPGLVIRRSGFLEPLGFGVDLVDAVRELAVAGLLACDGSGDRRLQRRERGGALSARTSGRATSRVDAGQEHFRRVADADDRRTHAQRRRADAFHALGSALQGLQELLLAARHLLAVAGDDLSGLARVAFELGKVRDEVNGKTGETQGLLLISTGGLVALDDVQAMDQHVHVLDPIELGLNGQTGPVQPAHPVLECVEHQDRHVVSRRRV